jgi:hypothetical protein
VRAILHAVRVEGLVEALDQFMTAEADVHRDRLGALEQPVEVLVEEGEPPLVDPQAFPHAIAEHEPGIEHRHHRFGARLQFAVDADQDRGVARIAGAIVEGFGHGRDGAAAPRRWQECS